MTLKSKTHWPPTIGIPPQEGRPLSKQVGTIPLSSGKQIVNMLPIYK